LFNLSGDVLAG